MIGGLLRPIRAGMNRTAWHNPAFRSAREVISVTSTAFDDGTPIPQRHAGKGVGDNISPPLCWSGVPAEAVELVLIVEDPDVPLPRPIVHCRVTGIDPKSGGLSEGELKGYRGPRPIPGHGPHRYVFQVFALDAPSSAGIEGHVIAKGRLIGTYER